MFYVPLYFEAVRSRPVLVFWLATLAQAVLWLLVPMLFYAAPPAGLAPADPVTQIPPPPDSVSPPGPGPRRCAPPPLPAETPTGTTLSVPGIPILISLRRVPGPFG